MNWKLLIMWLVWVILIILIISYIVVKTSDKDELPPLSISNGSLWMTRIW